MPTQKQMIEETYKAMVEIKILLMGVKNSGDKGLIGEFNDLKANYYKFKERALLIFGVAVGSGALVGSGISALINWLSP